MLRVEVNGWISVNASIYCLREIILLFPRKKPPEALSRLLLNDSFEGKIRWRLISRILPYRGDNPVAKQNKVLTYTQQNKLIICRQERDLKCVLGYEYTHRGR